MFVLGNQERNREEAEWDSRRGVEGGETEHSKERAYTRRVLRALLRLNREEKESLPPDNGGNTKQKSKAKQSTK
jgi:hypothetical protein